MQQRSYTFISKVILLILLLSGKTHDMYAGADCRYMLIRENKLERPIPSARITNYEECVNSLNPGNEEDKSLLISSYDKLIRYYDSVDNQTKVEEYRKKLQALQK